jgi:hypothetical protein
MVEYWQKTSQTPGRRAIGCNLVVLKSALPQANCKIQAPFSATPGRATQGACVSLSLKMRFASFYFERSCAEQRLALQ